MGGASTSLLPRAVATVTVEPIRDLPETHPLDYDWLIREPDPIGRERSALVTEVHRITDRVAMLAGGGAIPAPGSPRWWAAGPLPRLAGLLVLAEQAVLTDPHQLARRQVRDVSMVISRALDWSAVAHRLAYDRPEVIAARRARPGPLHAHFDPVTAARWVATGCGEEPTA